MFSSQSSQDENRASSGAGRSLAVALRSLNNDSSIVIRPVGLSCNYDSIIVTRVDLCAVASRDSRFVLRIDLRTNTTSSYAGVKD